MHQMKRNMRRNDARSEIWDMWRGKKWITGSRSLINDNFNDEKTKILILRCAVSVHTRNIVKRRFLLCNRSLLKKRSWRVSLMKIIHRYTVFAYYRTNFIDHYFRPNEIGTSRWKILFLNFESFHDIIACNYHVVHIGMTGSDIQIQCRSENIWTWKKFSQNIQRFFIEN